MIFVSGWICKSRKGAVFAAEYTVSRQVCSMHIHTHPSTHQLTHIYTYMYACAHAQIYLPTLHFELVVDDNPYC